MRVPEGGVLHIHQAQWIENRPVLQLVPHWNWPDKAGKPVKVMAFTNADSVALSLNGQSLGDKPVDKYDFVSWDIPYAPGKLEAVAQKDGKEIARTVVETTGPAVALRLTPDRAALAGDGWDAQPFTVAALDAQGRVVPTANLPVEFECGGPGAIIGLGNGDPNSHEPEKGNRRSVFNGLAQVILQNQAGQAGPLVLRAKAAGLAPASVTINVTAAPDRPFVPLTAASSVSLGKWRMSPVAAAAPDPNQEIPGNDQNSWANVQPGKPQPLTGGNFTVLRIKFTPRADLRRSVGRLVFKSIAGRAEVWLDKRPLGKKDAFEEAPFFATIPAGDGEHTLSVLLEARAGQPVGLTGAVMVEPANGS